MGLLDSDLGQISEAVKIRKSALSNQSSQLLKLQLAEGSRIRFKQSTGTAYLRGVEATVVKINPKRLLVQVDAPANPWTKGKMLGKTIYTPLSLIELI